MSDEMAAAQARIRDLEARLDALTAQVEAFDFGRRVPAERPADDRSADRSQWGSSLGRRALLAGALGAAAGGALVARPAAAANGDPILIGESNVAVSSAPTLLSGPFQVDSSWATLSAIRGDQAAVPADSSALFVGVIGSTQGRYGVGVMGAHGSVEPYDLGPAGVVGYSESALGKGVRGIASAEAGETHGVHAESVSDAGVGVLGIASHSSGATCGVKGESYSTSGRAVQGEANATSGVTYGVFGRTTSPQGWAVYAEGRLKSTGRTVIGAPASIPKDADLSPGSVSFYVDAKANRLKVRVKYPNGASKTGSIALA